MEEIGSSTGAMVKMTVKVSNDHSGRKGHNEQ